MFHTTGACSPSPPPSLKATAGRPALSPRIRRRRNFRLRQAYGGQDGGREGESSPVVESADGSSGREVHGKVKPGPAESRVQRRLEWREGEWKMEGTNNDLVD